MSIVIVTVFFATLVVVAIDWECRRPVLISDNPAITSNGSVQIESRIPYDIRITSTPPTWCDPVELRVEFPSDDHGIVLEERWTVMEGDQPQMTFPSFDDLYYRCDGPDCFRITFIQKGKAYVMFVTLK